MEDNKMTNEEILRQQLELLAEESKKSSEEYISQISNAMCDIYKLLK